MAEQVTTLMKSRRRIAAPPKMGNRINLERQSKGLADVRFGSKADMEGGPINDRFTPESGHR
jgi:hypothetical protein